MLSDASEGMVRDAHREIESLHFDFTVFDCESIPFEDESFDLVVANHVMFYCKDIQKALSEIYRVLKPEGRLICSTYGLNHMKEVTELVQIFDEKVVLSSNSLVNRFGKENGQAQLADYFSDIQWKQYDDQLNVDNAEALIAYILSCHGNQNEHLIPKYKEFCAFVRSKTKNGFVITKDAGIFVAKKQNNS